MTGAATPAPAGPREALLVDFGGVLTTSVFDAFAEFCVGANAEPDLVRRLLSGDAASSALLVEHESGRLDDEGFEAGFAERLRAHGLDVPAAGLLRRMMGGLRPDDAMLAAVRGIRAAGVPTAIVSNSMGRDSYAGHDLHAIADVVVLSGEIGTRKPSRRIFQVACERLGVPPERCVLVDDVERNLSGAARLGIHGILHVDAATTIAALREVLGVDPADAPGERRPSEPARS